MSVLHEHSVIRISRITAPDDKNYNPQIPITMADRAILQDAGKVSAEIAQAHALSEFEKCRVVQDRRYESDVEKAIKIFASEGGEL